MDDEMVAPIEVTEDEAIADFTDDSDIHLHMESLHDSKSDGDIDFVQEEEVEITDKPANDDVAEATTTAAAAVNDDDGVADVHLDHMEHVAPPISPAKAVFTPADENEGLSEDDVAKVLHTLEPAIKKEANVAEPTPSASTSDSSKSKPTTAEYSISPGRPPKLDVTPEEAEMARKQLEQLNQTTKGRPKSSLKVRHVDIVDDSGQVIKVPFQVVREKKSTVAPVASLNGRNGKATAAADDGDHEILNACPTSTAPKSFKQSRLSLKKTSSLITPAKPTIKPDPANTGTIEIPNELIFGTEDINASMILNTSSGSGSKSLQNEDLIAILEGSDTETSAPMDKETEKKLAMQQMMTLPLKARGRRPKLSNTTAKEPMRCKPVNKQEPVSDLVSSLVSEWSESDNDDSKCYEQNEKPAAVVKVEHPVVKPKVTAVAKTVQPPTFGVYKRARIIKKKIIWDPDAPETAISYASLVQPTAIAKKIHASAIAKKSDPPKILNKRAPTAVEPPANVVSDAKSHKRATETASPSGQKKRKVSEVDKLLGDEGAINMLNALKQENNNADTDSTKSGRESVTKLRITKPATTRDSVSPTIVVPKSRAKRPQTPQKSIASPTAAIGTANSGSLAVAVAAVGVAVKKESGSKRKKTTAGSQSWDYIYSHQNEDSLIIRRRSNSSYSSTTSPSRLSLDAAPQPSTSSSSTGKVSKVGRPPKDKNFEFAKPNAMKPQTETQSSAHSILMDIQTKPPKASVPAAGKNASAASVRRSARAGMVPDGPTTGGSPPSIASMRANDEKLTAKEKRAIHKSEMEIEAKRRALDTTKGEEVTVTRHKDVAHIVLRPDDKKLKNVFTTTLMDSVTKTLNNLDADATCKVVLVTSARDSFCNGLDYSKLVQATAEKRKASSAELSLAVRDFIHTLATFKKTLIAGVNGQAVGIGVTILPLFDLVFASESSTFETPYGRIGQVAEACTAFSLSNKVNQTLKNQLLVMGEPVDVETARLHGLVTKVFDEDTFMTDIMQQSQEIASFSTQALESTKALMVCGLLSHLADSLDGEQELLQQHWSSAECQESIKHFLTTHKW